jgi:hypothetical protein
MSEEKDENEKRKQSLNINVIKRGKNSFYFTGS